ncbi:uncharacterized protein LOC128243592 [Mya arenaria]|uniref:uncharacterized protein LOC128243592 n=1 Tax=Mya arenaria TaxID=6604 RepID=UPI0022DF54CB|nr:uncharacterized protein LOC128243592 [Mya arenaria]
MEDGVKEFLDKLGMRKYFDMFVAKGFDKEGDISHLTEGDLKSMYIIDTDDRNRILEAAHHFHPSRKYMLHEWLQAAGLSHYFISFMESDLTDIAALARLKLPDEDLYDELEITLPGHKRRLERAVRQLAKNNMTRVPKMEVQEPENENKETTGSDVICLQKPELAVTYGRWGKPRCLLDAKYDFLLLEATVVSTLDSRDRVDIEFMVDSGSDVVTMRQEVLDSLDLELIGPINSKGVHASRVKNLYKANIVIGHVSLEIEVMGESYDSIGSRVLRHFRHYISGSQHIWLKGDFIDPTLASKELKPGNNEDKQIIVGDDENISVIGEKCEPLVKELAFESKALAPEDLENLGTNELSAPEESDDHLVQNDHVKMDKVDKKGLKVHENMGFENKVSEFKFKGINQEKENEIKNSHSGEMDSNGHVDETDKLVSGPADVIDVRPIIASNRKRHAQNSKSANLSAIIAERENGKTVKRHRPNERKLHSLIQVVNSEPCDSKSRGVLNQRSVYYHAEENHFDTYFS